jgi:hypothetical protein
LSVSALEDIAVIVINKKATHAIILFFMSLTEILKCGDDNIHVRPRGLKNYFQPIPKPFYRGFGGMFLNR